MSGILLNSYRQGNRSEYLANYLLSGLGLVITVTRQEDIGFDFYCQLSDKESGTLSFGFPFIVQVKSNSEKRIIYGTEDPKNWKREQINWLFRLEVPFLIGVVYKKEMRIDFYNTTSLHLIFIHHPDPSIIELKPRLINKSDDIQKPPRQKIDGWDNSKGDGFRYTVDLGNPIVSINNQDFDEVNGEVLNGKKHLLRNLIQLDQQNYVGRNLNIPYASWIRQIVINESFIPGWHNGTPTRFNLNKVYSSMLGQSIISIAINLWAMGKHSEALALKPILKNIPKIQPSLKKLYPKLFKWLL